MNDEILTVLGILARLEERTGAMRVRFETSLVGSGLCVVFDWLDVSYRTIISREELQSSKVNLLDIIENRASSEHEKWSRSELGS